MAKLIRYVPSSRGLGALRSSPEVDEMLEGRAHRVASAAKAAYAAFGHPGIEVEVLQQGSDTRAPRARVAVIARTAAAIRLEAEHRALGGSLDAARG